MVDLIFSKGYVLIPELATEVASRWTDDLFRMAEARESLAAYKQYVMHGYIPAPYLDHIDSLLVQVAQFLETRGERGIQNLLISMPPRHGKTLSVGVMFATWLLGRNPALNVITTAYGAALAVSTSRKARRVVRSQAYQSLFALRIADELRGAGDWSFKGYQGGMSAMGVLGAATGKGADCFSAGTLVTTTDGDIPIERLCALENPPYIIGFCHKTGQQVRARIAARRVIKSDKLIRVHFHSGKALDCTPDHRIFADGEYVAAERLKPNAVVQTVSRLRYADDQNAVFSVLQRITPQDDRFDLCKLRDGISAAQIRSRQSAEQGLQRFVLRESVQRGAPCDKKCGALQDLREAQKAGALVLQQRMQAAAAQGCDTALQGLRERIRAQPFAPNVLQSDLCKPRAFKANDRAQNPQGDSRRKSKQHPVQENTPLHIGARQSQLRGVRGDNQIAHTPYRRELAQSPPRKSDNDVQFMPYNAPQIAQDAVSRIERLSANAKPVYDIQVEGCHNFFANGILVHNCLLIDDPIKNRAEAESERIRDRVWADLQDSFFTRLNDAWSTRVVIGTRWHIDDPIGRLLKTEGDKWHVVTFPAYAEDDDILREQGEPLVFPSLTKAQAVSRYESRRKSMTLASWSALYQQAPIETIGGFFLRDWLNIVNEPPEISYAVRYWDLAMSDNPSADYTAGVKIGAGSDGHFYVLDVVRRRVDWGELIQFVAGVMIADGAEVTQGIEKAGYMTRAVRDLNEHPALRGYAIMGYNVDRKKEVRALPVQAKFSSGVLHIVRGHWTDAYIEELLAFGKDAPFDDQVDATSGAWAMLDGMAGAIGFTSWG